jgi:hypothetical protein
MYDLDASCSGGALEKHVLRMVGQHVDYMLDNFIYRVYSGNVKSEYSRFDLRETKYDAGYVW